MWKQLLKSRFLGSATAPFGRARRHGRAHFRPTLNQLEDRVVPSVTADFNGDGFSDLAVGVPYASDNGALSAGAVHIVYGSAAGLSAVNTQVLTQDSLGLDSSEQADFFGLALAPGDFNGDGKADLAIGVEGENVGNNPAAGA